MRIWRRSSLVMILVGLLTACAPTSADVDALITQQPTPTSTAAPPTATSAYPPLEHRDAPAPEGAFIEDPVTWVENTGRPQLIEFYSDT